MTTDMGEALGAWDIDVRRGLDIEILRDGALRRASPSGCRSLTACYGALRYRHPEMWYVLGVPQADHQEGRLRACGTRSEP